MNFPFTLGKKVVTSTHSEYRKITFPTSSPLKMGRRTVSYSLIENAQEVDSSHWYDMLDTFQFNLDAAAVSNITGQLSTDTTVEIPVLLFEVPENGRMTVIEKDGRLLYLFQTFNYRFWEIPLGNSTDASKRPLGNTLIFSREPFADFHDDNVHNIIKEVLINWAVANKGGRLFFLGSERITSAQTTRINHDRVIANPIVNFLTNPVSGFDSNLYMPTHNYFLPVKEGDLIPLFDIERSQLSVLTPVKFKIGIADIPLTPTAPLATQEWSWFQTLEFFFRKALDGVVLQQQDAATPSIFNDYVRTNSVKGWFPLSTPLNPDRINKINYKNLEIFNPTQNKTLFSQVSEPNIKSIPLNTFFFNGSDNLEVHSVSSCNWEERFDFGNLSTTSPILLGNNVNTINVAAPSLDPVQIVKYNTPPPPPVDLITLNVRYIQNYNSDNNSSNDDEYFLSIFIQKIFQVRFRTSADINSWFQLKTNLSFLEWYQVQSFSKNISRDANIASRFNSLWDNILIIFSKSEINIIEFICLMITFVFENPRIDPSLREHGGLNYLFKYNTRGDLGNKTALSLFRDSDFLQHRYLTQYLNPPAINIANLLFEGDNPPVSSGAWGGITYPSSTFHIEPVLNDNGVVLECDFYKFSGLGPLQITGRNIYIRLMEFILNSMSTNSLCQQIGGDWLRIIGSTSTSIIPAQKQRIATISQNEQWERLFNSPDFFIAAASIMVHNRNRQYLNIPLNASVLTSSHTHMGSIKYQRYRVKGRDINKINEYYTLVIDVKYRYKIN